MNGTRNSKKDREKTFLIIDSPRSRPSPNESFSLVFKYKYLEQALFFNHHFLAIILVGFFGMFFTPIQTKVEWVNESIDFINALMLGIGVSGVICWCFAFKIKGEINQTVWTACHVLLNVCHILCVLFTLGFFFAVGIKPDGAVSALACGTFSALILGIMLSMKYAYKN